MHYTNTALTSIKPVIMEGKIRENANFVQEGISALLKKYNLGKLGDLNTIKEVPWVFNKPN